MKSRKEYIKEVNEIMERVTKEYSERVKNSKLTCVQQIKKDKEGNIIKTPLIMLNIK